MIQFGVEPIVAMAFPQNKTPKFQMAPPNRASTPHKKILIQKKTFV